MFKRKHYYGEFLEMEERIATNILADRLLLLEESGIVSRTIDESHNSKKIYRLTAKGIDLLPLLVEVILWSAKYDNKSAVDVKFVKRAKRDRDKLINGIRCQLESE